MSEFVSILFGDTERIRAVCKGAPVTDERNGILWPSIRPLTPPRPPEWAALQKHYDELQAEGVSLKKWFAEDDERVDKLSFDAGDLHFDLSKNLIKPETLQLFANLAKAVKLSMSAPRLCTQACTSTTPKTAPCCTPRCAARSKTRAKYIVDGQDTVKDVREVLDRIYAFADKVRSGEWTGVTGKKIETVVNIGIGGSDLGPVMVYEALKPYADAGISARYISNIDPNDLAEKTKGLDPETTPVHHRLQDLHHPGDPDQRP